MTHVIIDEFQDISPIILRWITGVFNLLNKSLRPTSVMAVGDEWQCIYGWRGSSPHILTDTFDRYFTCQYPSKLVLLVDNFRCTQNIIDKAEHVFSESLVTEGKSGKAFSTSEGTFGVEYDLEDRTIASRIVSVIRGQEPECGEQKTLIMVLARTRSKLDMIKKEVRKMLAARLPNYLEFNTVHGSKGLEAEYVFVIGDSRYSDNNLVRQMIYRYAGFPIGYDDATEEEAKRLVYVAITRAKHTIYYFVKKNEKGVVSDFFKEDGVLSQTKIN